MSVLHERSKIPDHSILLAEFRIHDTTCQSPPSSSATCSTKRYKLNAIPVDFLSSNISKLALQSVIQRIESARETQNEVDDIYSTLCKLLVAEMDANIPNFDTSKRTKKKKKNKKKNALKTRNPFGKTNLPVCGIQCETEKGHFCVLKAV